MTDDTEKDDEILTAMPPRIAAIAANLPAGKKPPVHLWNPEFTGDLDMRIAAEGTWFYRGSAIQRPAMVALFSGILKKEGSEIFLVTPVEKYRIQVDDAPFIALDMDVHGNGDRQILTFRTNVDDYVMAGADHALRLSEADTAAEAKPYLMVRDGLEALVARSVYYRLAELGVVEKQAGTDMFGIWSAGVFFPFMEAGGLDLDRDVEGGA